MREMVAVWALITWRPYQNQFAIPIKPAPEEAGKETPRVYDQEDNRVAEG